MKTRSVVWLLLLWMLLNAPLATALPDTTYAAVNDPNPLADTKPTLFSEDELRSFVTSGGNASVAPDLKAFRGESEPGFIAVAEYRKGEEREPNPVPLPEPGTVALLGLALMALLGRKFLRLRPQ